MVISMLFYYYDYLLIQNYQKVIKIDINESIVKLKDNSYVI